MENKGLNSTSKAYYEKQLIYEIFSNKEDTPRIIEQFLKKHILGGTVLDAGCGSGKFLPCLEELSSQYIGIDLSENQISVAFQKKKKENTFLKVDDLENLSFENGSFDFVVSAWVLGTITDLEKRKKVVENLKRVLKPNGTIYLIENDITGMFETIRGHNQDKKTEQYNEWLLKQGFQVVEKIHTYFDFESLEEAKHVFLEIYGEYVSKKIVDKRVNHDVLILEYKLT